jgi:rhomboid family GlyGly-CTERM serine protease
MIAAVATTALSFAAPSVRDTLIADPRVFAGQGWRLVTAPLVHATWGHLVRDLSLVAIAGIAYEAVLPRALFGLGLVVPVLAVLLAGHVDWYCGLSGLSHALLAAALTYEALHRCGRVRIAVLVLCAVAITKPLYELVTGAPAFAMDLGPHVVQTPLAHAAGVVVGIACVAIASPARRARDRDPPLPSPSRPDRRRARAG